MAPQNQPTNILTLTLRLHDPDEKKDAAQSTSWVTLKVPREDLTLTEDAFVRKYLLPALPKLKQLALGV